MTNSKDAAVSGQSSTDRFEKERVFAAPRSRVWRAITNVKEFSTWFRIGLTTPFVPGAVATGNLTAPGNEQFSITLWITEVVPEHRFSFRWHPFAIEAGVDYSAEPTTLVTFTLDEVEDGTATRVRIVETGFDAIPEARRAKAFQMNEKGWASQLEKIGKYVAEHP